MFICSNSIVKDRGLYKVENMIDGVLGSLVAVSAGCPLFRVYEGLIVGAVGAALALVTWFAAKLQVNLETDYFLEI